MANEKGQGTRGADVKNLQACYQLMLGGAMDDAGVLLESYLSTHDIDAESAPITLAYVMRTVEVAKCIRGEKYEAQKNRHRKRARKGSVATLFHGKLKCRGKREALRLLYARRALSHVRR